MNKNPLSKLVQMSYNANQVIQMNNRNIYSEIKALQSKLNENIKKHGLHDKRTVALSEQIDLYVNYYFKCIVDTVKYPKGNKMFMYYQLSYDRLKEYSIKNKFPSIDEWNRLVKDENLLSSESMKYISKLDWKYLKIKVKREINMKIL